MSRILLRRLCGHLEAVYATGAVAARIREREREICGVCRRRRTFSEGPEEERTSPEPPPERKSPGEVEVVLKERRQFSTNDNEGGSA